MFFGGLFYIENFHNYIFGIHAGASPQMKWLSIIIIIIRLLIPFGPFLEEEIPEKFI